MSSKSAPRTSKSAPRAPPVCSRAPQERTKSEQEPTKSDQARPKTAKGRPKSTPRAHQGNKMVARAIPKMFPKESKGDRKGARGGGGDPISNQIKYYLKSPYPPGPVLSLFLIYKSKQLLATLYNGCRAARSAARQHGPVRRQQLFGFVD